MPARVKCPACQTTLGVASSKLAREDIDGVGFAVPAADVLALLRGKGISLAPAGPAAKLDGPALACAKSPATSASR